MSDEISARGTSGAVTFDGYVVTIHRTGLSRATIGKGIKQIPLDHITGVQFKPAGPLMNGFIQFTLAGCIERQSRFGRQTYEAVTDENSVAFTRKQAPAFEEIRGRIQGAVTARLRGQYGPVQSAPDVPARMQQLQRMLEDGLITPTEFDLKRKELLEQL